MPVVKIKAVLRILAGDGWGWPRRMEVIGSSSIRPSRAVSVAGNDSDGWAPGTFNSILKQAGLKGH